MDIIDSVDTWKRVAGYSQPDGSFVIATVDPDVKALLTQLVVRSAEQTAVLQNILARLNAGNKTQAGVISVNL